MALKNDILKELINSDDYISGEALALKFGKTRAAVWKAVKSLEKQGYSIDAVTNKGYRLCGGKDILSAHGISALLERDIEVEHLKAVDSTNTYCKRLLAHGREGEFLVVSDTQSAGRGRQGKSFYSPAQSGVYFSLVLRPYAPMQNVVTATTAAAVAVCKAIEQLTSITPQIKWVNDVFVNGKKICGILTEAITDFEEGIVESVIVGIGINISTQDFPSEVNNAGCLDCSVDKNQLIACVVNELMKIACGDYKSFIDYYRSHSMVIGKQIIFTENHKPTVARAVAIDETGGLEIELADSQRRILRSGEISIRTI